jgi:hypothetical protein
MLRSGWISAIEAHKEEIPIENVSIYLGLSIWFGREDCVLHGRGLSTSMKERITRLGHSNLNTTQKLEGVNFMKLARTDYWMTRLDLTADDICKFEARLRGEIMR